MTLAAIDIGSNAARLLITEVVQDANGNTVFNKLNLIRVPLRLGFDVFEGAVISKHRIGMMLQTMKAFKHLCNAYDVTHIKACATSAMRDAKNSADIIQLQCDEPRHTDCINQNITRGTHNRWQTTAYFSFTPP